MNKYYTCLFLLLISLHNHSSAREPVVIGFSNSAEATAYSNGRRMVRTMDDRLFVVFQDSVNDNHVVKWTWSDSGFNWSMPKKLGDGNNPSLAISKEGWIYAVWAPVDSGDACGKYLQPNSLEWRQNETAPILGARSKYPSIEAVDSGVYVVWQQFNEAQNRDLIRIRKFGEGFKSVDSSTIYLGGEKGHARFPVITGDLEFAPGLLHVLWTEFSSSGESSQIYYLAFDEYEDYDVSPGQDKIAILPQLVPDSDGKAYPSISIRNDDYYYPRYKRADVVMAYADILNHNLITASAWVHRDTPIETMTRAVSTSRIPWPSVDDVLPFARSCAIVWQDSSDVFYGQTEDERIVTLPAIPVSRKNGSFKKYPGVCYKTFRADFFDAVWTEGDEPPYKVMYRRMPKVYSDLEDSLRITTKELPPGVYGHNYSCQLKSSVDRYKTNCWLISGTLPEGLSFNGYDDPRIYGIPKASGDFELTFMVDFARIDDLPKAADTSSFTLTVINHPPKITSPDTGFVSRSSQFLYVAKATDADYNPIFYKFLHYPFWLSPQDSELKGFVPEDAVDTSFVLVASDGELADTLYAFLDVLGVGTFVPEKNEKQTPQQFYLAQNYPNPFNPTTTIKFGLPKQSHVRLTIFNINGKVVDELINREMTVGHHQLNWDASNQAAGTYFVKMEAGQFHHLVKCILLK